MDYTKTNPLETEAEYPYVAKAEACKYDKPKGEVSVTETIHVTPDSPE